MSLASVIVYVCQSRPETSQSEPMLPHIKNEGELSAAGTLNARRVIFMEQRPTVDDPDKGAWHYYATV